MVKRRSLILLSLVLLMVGLMSAGGWLVATRSGALWLFSQFRAEDSVRIELTDLRGSLLSGLELQGLGIDWAGGHLVADQLQVNWQPIALFQQRLKIDLLRGGGLDWHFPNPAKKEEAVTPDPGALLIPDIKPLLAALGGWSLELQGLQVDSLQLTGSDGKTTRLKNISGRLQCSSAQLNLSQVEVDGDWGLWRGALRLVAADPLLSGELSWTPSESLGRIKTLVAQLSLARTADGWLRGPARFETHGEEATGYRLTGDLLLDLGRLELRGLQLDHGSETAGLVHGELRLGWQDQFSWRTSLKFTDLNLLAELDQVTQLNGNLQLEGGLSSYRGRVDLRNDGAGWEQLRLSGDLVGDATHLALNQLQVGLLGGDAAGGVELDWHDGLTSTFKLQGQNLQLSKIPTGPDGMIDLQVDGWLNKSPNAGLELGGTAQITKGILLGRDFSGDLRAEWQGGRRLKIDNMELRGAWGELKAQGDLQRHLVVNLTLHDAAALWPPLEAQGELTGWLAWTADWPHGALSGQLKNLGYQEWRAAELSLAAEQPLATTSADLQLKFADLHKGDFELADLDLKLQGLPREHQLQLQLNQNGNQVALALDGGLHQKTWRARVATLDLNVQEIESYHLLKPFEISYDPAEMSFSEIQLQSNRDGWLILAANWNRQDESRRAEGTWKQINLSWLKLWLAGMQFDGETSGQGSFAQSQKGGLVFDLQAEYAGDFAYAGQKLQFDNAQLVGRWDNQRLDINVELLEHRGGKLQLGAGSTAEPGFYVPQSGDLHLKLKDLPLALINTQLPPGRELDGLLAADIDGHWQSAGWFTLAGKTRVEEGLFRYHDGVSLLELPFEQTELDFNWQKTGLTVNMSLGLSEGDGLAGDLNLQLPARWPLELESQLPISGELQFHLGKLGVLSLLVPEQLADLSGEISGALRLAGSLQQPDFEGDLRLRGGQINLRQLGIKLEKIGLQAVFRAQQLRIEQLTASAGEGQLHGHGEVRFSGWQPERFTLELKGENALIANLPELRAIASPDLLLDGDTDGLTLGGVLKIPELQITNWHPAGPIVRSEDVVYIDQLTKSEPQKSLKYNLDLDVELGDKVLVKDRGLDVRLKGLVHLSRANQTGVLARGQIDIPEGHYSTYGVKLPISSGRLYFNGGPVDNPALDILATKKILEVSAGVAVDGTARQPLIRLISDPALDDTDILSYIVLGRPTFGGSGDFNVLSLAAGALLSAGDSASFQQKLKSRSGLDVIDVNTGSEGLESAVVTVGKYLTPDLYLSYGRAISSGINQIQFRYSPTKRVDIESQLGEVSGADLYYKIEFN